MKVIQNKITQYMLDIHSNGHNYKNHLLIERNENIMSQQTALKLNCLYTKILHQVLTLHLVRKNNTFI